MFVTLRHLRENGACFSGYNKVVCSLKNIDYIERSRYISFKYDGKISIEYIAKSNNVRDALWAFSTINKKVDDTMLSIWIARRIQHLMKPEMVMILNEFEQTLCNDNIRATALNYIFDASNDLEKHVARVLYSVICKSGAFLVYADLNAVVAETMDYDKYDEQIIDMISKMCNNTAPWQQTSQG